MSFVQPESRVNWNQKSDSIDYRKFGTKSIGDTDRSIKRDKNDRMTGNPMPLSLLFIAITLYICNYKIARIVRKIRSCKNTN